MTAPVVKGWCPGALTPMMSGDGLVVRVRPFGGRITAAQAAGLAELAQAHGNGLIDLSSRANLQIRGVREDRYAALLDGLGALGLLDASPRIEARRNILVTPFWEAGDETDMLCAAMTQALSQPDAPDLPKKFGFAIDTGPLPVLRDAPADIRLERDESGDLLILADTAPVGRPIAKDDAIPEVFELLRWFLALRGAETRMAAVFRRDGVLPQDHFVAPQAHAYRPVPGLTPHGALVGLAFGQITAQSLAAVAELGALRMTPWRMVLVEGLDVMPQLDGLITDASDPLLRVTACTGAPGCAQGHIDTRGLARRLVKHTRSNGLLHVSGCAKGCAHPKPAAMTITGTPSGLDLIRDGCAHDTPQATKLTFDTLLKAI